MLKTKQLRALTARALVEDGHVVVASDGAEALDALARQPFDVMLADIKMPVMDGIARALAAAREDPHLVVMLMRAMPISASAPAASAP